jgi:hypothetical protein
MLIDAVRERGVSVLSAATKLLVEESHCRGNYQQYKKRVCDNIFIDYNE